MTDNRLPLTELLQKSGEGDFLRAVAERSSDSHGSRCRRGDRAGRHERSADRLTHHCDIVETGNDSWRSKNRA